MMASHDGGGGSLMEKFEPGLELECLRPDYGNDDGSKPVCGV